MRYSASIAAVNASFLRMSATRKAFRNVRSTASGLEQLAGPARGLDLLARGLREAVGVHGQRLRDLPLGEHLYRHAPSGREPTLALRVRMWIGVWPPSSRTRWRCPDRAPAPFCPRPDFFP